MKFELSGISTGVRLSQIDFCKVTEVFCDLFSIENIKDPRNLGKNHFAPTEAWVIGQLLPFFKHSYAVLLHEAP